MEIRDFTPEEERRWNAWFESKFNETLKAQMFDEKSMLHVMIGGVVKATLDIVKTDIVEGKIDKDIDQLRREVAGRSVVAGLLGDRL